MIGNPTIYVTAKVARVTGKVLDYIDDGSREDGPGTGANKVLLTTSE